MASCRIGWACAMGRQAWRPARPAHVLHCAHAHVRQAGGGRLRGCLLTCVVDWWCLLPAPFFLLLDSGKENFARDRQAGGGQDLVALTEKAPRPWPPPPLPRPTAVRHKGCSYLFFFPAAERDVSGCSSFFPAANGHVSGSRSRASVTLVDACSLLCLL